MALLERRRPSTPRPRAGSQPRALTGSARVINLSDRQEAKRLEDTRQAWQLEAWAYRRSLPELRYGTSYLGNSASRMRIIPAAYRPGESEPTELTIENAAGMGFPEDLVEAALEALARLASGGPLAMSALLRKMTENFEVAGECFLIGQTDETTGVEQWDIRSVTEVDQRGTKVFIKETPNARPGSKDVIELDLDTTDFIRMWWPDPQYHGLADSPIRAVLDLCEELLLLGRDVRATARSRIANNGLLFVPDSLTLTAANTPGEEQDPNQDPFMTEFMATITTALQNEGSAAAVAPVLLRGPAEAGQYLRHITLTRPANAQNMAQRQELITRIATGIDLPSEVLTGKADLNHWSAWQVDDDTFRHHIEPIVVVECDALTEGFLWPQLDDLNESRGGRWDPALIRQIISWYDPTNLVTHPDRTKDAFDAWDRMALSDKALRKYLGFPEDDKPTNDELLLRMATHLRSLDPAVQVQILQRLDPNLAPPTPSQQIPVGGGIPEPEAQPPDIGPPKVGQPPAAAASVQRAAPNMNDIWRRYAAAVRELVEPPPDATAAVVDALLDELVPPR